MILLRFSIKGIGFINTIVIARLLSPSDFGIVAIAMALYALIDLFGSFGVDTVLIQKQDATEELYNTAWTINFGFGLFGFIILSCLAYPASVFYKNSSLLVVFFSVAFLFIITGSKNIGVVDFRKQMTFDKEFKFQIIPKLIGTIVSVSVAFWLKNYWALIIGSIVWKGSETIISYLIHPFRPRWSLVNISELFQFSKYLLFNNILQFLNTKSLEMIFGKMLSVGSVGLYSISQEIATIPTVEIIGPINRAVYPGYAKVASDTEILKELYAKSISLIAFFVIPAAMGIIVVSDIAIPFLLGEKWSEAIPLVQIFAFASLFLAVNSNTAYIFYAKGQPQILTKFSIIRVALVIPGVIIAAVYYDLYTVGVVLCCISIFMTFLYQRNIMKEFSLSFDYILNIYARPALASILMFISVKFYLIDIILPLMSKGMLLFLSIIVGIVVYISSIFLIWYICKRPDSSETMILEWLKIKFSSQQL